MSHFVFPILILIIAISRAFASARRDSGGSLPGPAAPRRTPPPPAESDAERQRRFREAVGLPPDSPLPPPVRPRSSSNPAPLLPVNPPPAYPGIPGRLRRVAPATPSYTGTPRSQTAARSIPPAPISTRTPAQASRPPALVAPIAPLTVVPQTPSVPRPPAPPLPAVQPSYPAKALLLRLRDPGAIREAIILREILGPPKAFQAGIIERLV